MGLGVDLVELGRVAKLGPLRLARRILTAREQEAVPTGEERVLEYVGGRFAAKEAVAKAAGTGIGAQLGFRDIEVLAERPGPPVVLLHPRSLQLLYGECLMEVQLSITHTREYALAAAIILPRPPSRPAAPERSYF